MINTDNYTRENVYEMIDFFSTQLTFELNNEKKNKIRHVLSHICEFKIQGHDQMILPTNYKEAPHESLGHVFCPTNSEYQYYDKIHPNNSALEVKNYNSKKYKSLGESTLKKDNKYKKENIDDMIDFFARQITFHSVSENKIRHVLSHICEFKIGGHKEMILPTNYKEDPESALGHVFCPADTEYQKNTRNNNKKIKNKL